MNEFKRQLLWADRVRIRELCSDYGQHDFADLSEHHKLGLAADLDSADQEIAELKSEIRILKNRQVIVNGKNL